MASPKPSAGLFARKNAAPVKPGKGKPPTKLNTYICVLTSGRVVEVRSEDMSDAGKACFDKHGQFPASVKKKPYVRNERLMDRPFAQNNVLREMKRTMDRKEK